jgi:hypothetical protein
MEENKNSEPTYQDPSDREQVQENAIRESAATGWGTTTVELPISIYKDLELLAADEQSDPIHVLERLITAARRQHIQRREVAEEQSELRTGNALQELLRLATDLGVDDLAEQHDHYLYGAEKR